MSQRSTYDAGFFHSQGPGSARSAAKLVPIVNQLVEPESVLEVGCGMGAWPAQWRFLGLTDVVALDGAYISEASLQIPLDSFIACDLAAGFDLGRRFDLVSTLEVAEHLPAEHAAEFVASLVRHSDLVLFSAAIPGQGGYGHVNEQWPSYWAGFFEKHGYRPHTGLRSKIWTDLEIEPWYRQNILIFATEAKAEELAMPLEDGPLDVTHPELAQLSMPLHRVLVERVARTRPGNWVMRTVRQHQFKFLGRQSSPSENADSRS